MLFDVFHGGETLTTERTHMFLLMVRQVSVHVESQPLLQNKQSWRAKEVISSTFAPILSFVRSSWALVRIFGNFWAKVTQISIGCAMCRAPHPHPLVCV